MLPLSEIQKVLYEALTAALAPVPVLDAAGPDQLFPYVTIGEFSALPNNTLLDLGVDTDLSVHVWSRQPGMKETEVLMQVAVDALNYKQFTTNDFQWVQTIWQFAQTMRDPDGLTRHGVLRFRVMTFQIASP